MDKQILEKLVEENSLSWVVENLVNICHEKAQKILENSRDLETANFWDDAASRIDRVWEELEDI